MNDTQTRSGDTPWRKMRMFTEVNTDSPIWDAGPFEVGPIDLSDIEVSDDTRRALREWVGEWEDEFDVVGQGSRSIDPVRYADWYKREKELCQSVQMQLGTGVFIEYDQIYCASSAPKTPRADCDDQDGAR